MAMVMNAAVAAVCLFVSCQVVFVTLPVGVVVRYCDEYVCVCLSVCLRGYLQSHVQSLSNFLCMLPMAVARSSPSVVAIRFPGFVDDIMFFIYSGLYSGMNLAMKDHVRLNLLTYCSIGQNLIEYY